MISYLRNGIYLFIYLSVRLSAYLPICLSIQNVYIHPSLEYSHLIQGCTEGELPISECCVGDGVPSSSHASKLCPFQHVLASVQWTRNTGLYYLMIHLFCITYTHRNESSKIVEWWYGSDENWFVQTWPTSLKYVHENCIRSTQQALTSSQYHYTYSFQANCSGQMTRERSLDRDDECFLKNVF